MLLTRHVQGESARRAVAATELAVMLPFLLFMWIIAIDWARIFFYTVTLEYAARDGAYYASNYPGIYDYTSAQDAAFGETSNISPTPALSVTYDMNYNGSYASTTQPAQGGYVQVQVIYSFNTVTNFPGVPNTTTITRQVRMAMAPIIPGP
jgi:hypothetical protein